MTGTFVRSLPLSRTFPQISFHVFAFPRCFSIPFPDASRHFDPFLSRGFRSHGPACRLRLRDKPFSFSPRSFCCWFFFFFLSFLHLSRRRNNSCAVQLPADINYNVVRVPPRVSVRTRYDEPAVFISIVFLLISSLNVFPIRKWPIVRPMKFCKYTRNSTYCFTPCG